MNGQAWTAAAPARDGARAGWAEWLALSRPRIALMVLVAAAAAAFIASWGRPDLGVLLHTLGGTLLVTASASAMNQWLEQRRDALMERTAGRPLPSGRLPSAPVAGAAAAAAAAGAAHIAWAANGRAAACAVFGWFVYAWIYTPLKVRTPLNTMVGAVAGASPILIGWFAAGGTVDGRLAALFSVLFLWQFPHFMAIAWLYRRQYERAGFRMLTVVDPTGRLAGVQAVCCSLTLAPVTFTLWGLGGGGAPSAVLLVLCGAMLGVAALRFCVQRTVRSANALLRATLVYLPVVLGVLAATHRWPG